MRTITMWLIVLVGSLSAVGVGAENSAHKPSKTLTLNDAIQLAVRNNPEVRSARLQRVIDKFSLEVARNEFWPQYVFNAQGDIVEGKDPQFAVTPKVSLKMPLGTEIEAGVTSSFYQGRDTERFTASLRQPLLRGFGTDVTLARWKGALDGEQIAQLTLKDKVQSTVSAVIKSYYTLVEDYNRLDVDKQALDDSLQSLKSMKLRIEAGKIAPMEATQQEAQVANQRFTITQDQNVIDRDYQALLVLLGLDPNANLNIVRRIPEQKVVVPDMRNSIKTALEKNIGYIKNLLGRKSQERELLFAEDAQRWKLDLTASINKTLSIREDNRFIGYTGDDEDKRVGLELSIPIDDKANQKKLVDAKVGLQKFQIALDNERRSLITNVVNIVHDLQAHQAQIESAKRAVQLSEESLYVAQRKFEFGRTSMFEITSLRKSLTSRRQALVSQRIAYLNTLAKYEQTLGITLDKWHLQLNDRR